MDEEVMMSDNGTLDFNDHDRSILIHSVIKENENRNDLNKRLTVSRYVNDSGLKGMLTVVDTKSAEKIAQKELEQTKLEESSEENEISYSHLILDEACKDESEHKLLEQDVESCGKKSLLLEKTKEIVGLRRELVLISKLLTFHDNQLHHKISKSFVSASRNDKHVGSVTLTPKKLEELRALSHKQLINYFKTEMNQLKREHDIAIQEMTEEYFSVKRRCLNLEKPGLFYSLKENKEFDVLRKKIPDVISKLDKVLLEGEKSVFEEENSADIKSHLDSLLLENSQLKDSLSVAGEKMLQLSQVEANHRKLIQKLESDAEDLRIEASIYADVYGSFVKEFVNHVRCAKERAGSENHIMREAYELISKDLVNREAFESNNDLKDSCLKSYMTEECCSVTYKGILKETYKKLGEWNIDEFKKEWSLRSGKENSTKETHWLERLLMKKDNLVKTAESDLATEMEKLEIQINNLQYQIDQQALVIQDKNKELKVVSARALEKIKGHEMEISELRQNLELARMNMKITEKENVNSEMKLISSEADQKRLKNQCVSMVLSLARWAKGFDSLECLIAEKTKGANFRLKSMHSQLSDLLDEVDYLKARESNYKQLMEAKTCDLQKAETEVDLLGDEIESLMDLLEKIYIALDHYSPILKHYPGIIEILKLVRRELRG